MCIKVMMTTSALKSYEADVNAIQLVSTLCLFCAFVIPVSDLPFELITLWSPMHTRLLGQLYFASMVCFTAGITAFVLLILPVFLSYIFVALNYLHF